LLLNWFEKYFSLQNLRFSSHTFEEKIINEEEFKKKNSKKRLQYILFFFSFSSIIYIILILYDITICLIVNYDFDQEKPINRIYIILKIISTSIYFLLMNFTGIFFLFIGIFLFLYIRKSYVTFSFLSNSSKMRNLLIKVLLITFFGSISLIIKSCFMIYHILMMSIYLKEQSINDMYIIVFSYFILTEILPFSIILIALCNFN
jgi:hypothetical protein